MNLIRTYQRCTPRSQRSLLQLGLMFNQWRLHIAPNDDAMRTARDRAHHVAMALSVCALAQRTAVIGK